MTHAQVDGGSCSVSLADVYSIDFERRTEDRDLWIREIQKSKAEIVIEAGCGTGRVLSMIQQSCPSIKHWHGIDISQDMLDQFNLRHDVPGFRVCGDIADPSAWREITSTALADVVIIPYSAFFLVPHKDQIKVLQNAITATKPGGRILIEVFIPQFIESKVEDQWSGCGSPDGAMALWARKSTYDINTASRVTRIHRQYGPIRPSGGIDAKVEINETVYWLEPESLRELAIRSGVGRTSLRIGKPVPMGHCLIELGV